MDEERAAGPEPTVDARQETAIVPHVLEHFDAEDSIEGMQQLPPELEKRLARVNALCKNAGGGLYSRQIVAIVIEQWEREDTE